MDGARFLVLVLVLRRKTGNAEYLTGIQDMQRFIQACYADPLTKSTELIKSPTVSGIFEIAWKCEIWV
jgi:hypothetical protein